MTYRTMKSRRSLEGLCKCKLLTLAGQSSCGNCRRSAPRNVTSMRLSTLCGRRIDRDSCPSRAGHARTNGAHAYTISKAFNAEIFSKILEASCLTTAASAVLFARIFCRAVYKNRRRTPMTGFVSDQIKLIDGLIDLVQSKMRAHLNSSRITLSTCREFPFTRPTCLMSHNDHDNEPDGNDPTVLDNLLLRTEDN
jgi:hypothetical protein